MEDNKNINTNIDEINEVDSKKETNKDTVATENNKSKEEKLYTQEEIDKMITKRLEREKKKAEEEKAEAERLAKLSEAERQAELFNKEKAKFEEERKSFQKQQLELQITKELVAKDLPSEFANYLIGENAETSLENIKVFEEKWISALEKAVQNKLKDNSYVPPTSGKTGITKEDFAKMGYKERTKLYSENPDLYNELSK